MPFDAALKETEALLIKKKGLLFHSTSLFFENSFFLFSGVATSGKTTFAKKMRENNITITHDDRNLLFFENDKIFVSLPNFLINLKNTHYINDKNVVAPLERFFIIKKEFAKPSFIQKIENRDILWEFLFKVTPLPENKNLLKNYYNLIDRFSKELNAFYFYHNLKDSANDILKIITK